MSQVLPTKFLNLKELAEVPRSEYTEGPKLRNAADTKSRHAFLRMLRRGPSKADNRVNPNKISRATFNAAVWLRFHQTPEQPISLWLVYRDERGEFAAFVDEARMESGLSTMLSGCVTIETRGEIKYMRACAGGMKDNSAFGVDELYVQRQSERTSSGDQKLA